VKKVTRLVTENTTTGVKIGGRKNDPSGWVNQTINMTIRMTDAVNAPNPANTDKRIRIVL